MQPTLPTTAMSAEMGKDVEDDVSTYLRTAGDGGIEEKEAWITDGWHRYKITMVRHLVVVYLPAASADTDTCNIRSS